jgi:hypothetical protein
LYDKHSILSFQVREVYAFANVRGPESKPVLGRGLGELMKEAKAPSRTPAESEAESTNLSPGMAALLRAGSEDPPAEAGAELKTSQPEAPGKRPEPQRTKWLLRGSLLLADALLLGLVASLAFRGNRPLSLMEAALCVIAILTGAWLSLIAIWDWRKPK